MLPRALSLVAFWIAAFLLLWWGRLPIRWRQAFAILMSAGGVLLLILAVNTEGLRESPTVGVFLMGTPYVAARASASASLTYYVLSGGCLVLGFAGLVVRETVVEALSRRWVANAVVFSWLVTGLRFVLEKAAAPEAWTELVGITWLAPVVGGYFALNTLAEGRSFGTLLAALFCY